MASRIDTLVAGVAAAVIVAFLAFGVLVTLGLLGEASTLTVAAASDDGSSEGYGGGYGGGAPAVGAEATAPGAISFEPRRAWYDGESIEYYDLGAHTPLDGQSVAVAKIWVFIRGFDADGRPRFIAGQPSIVDDLPGDEGYSDLWDVQFVIVPEDRDAGDIRSLEALEASGLEIVAAERLVNCPIVPLGSTFSNGQRLNDTWYEGERAVYPTFGVTSATPIPVWTFITGFDGAGRPIPVPGQDPVIDADPDDADYSQFQRLYYVTVDADYEPNSIRSAKQIVASGYGVTPTAIVLNRPLVPSD